ncbi:MAG: ribosome small subunit-dependent GTPase A [Gemmatimonadetes bacterium]|nr:ribosome small subunit-dependent GTPase A [Gemmatimonadota bacterium]
MQGGGGGLERLGWRPFFADGFTRIADEHLQPGRVAVQHRNAYRVYVAEGDLPAELAGRLRHETADEAELPVVGDWVALRARAGEGRATIHAVLPRQSRFSRNRAGRSTGEQVLAANVDVVFLVSALDDEVNARRIERYLTLAWDSGAEPVVVLSKADLASDAGDGERAVRAIALGVPVHVVSGRTGVGLEHLRPYLAGDRTAALLGPSGVGKSTLINALIGSAVQAVAEVRERDRKGRHTTTRRELLALPGGGLLLDTPGMRELQLWEGSEGLRETFEDVEQLASGCRFTSCHHESEPGCAVTEAVAAGLLSEARLISYHKLQREIRHLDARRDVQARQREQGRVKAATKGLRARVRAKRGD